MPSAVPKNKQQESDVCCCCWKDFQLLFDLGLGLVDQNVDRGDNMESLAQALVGRKDDAGWFVFWGTEGGDVVSDE